MEVNVSTAWSAHPPPPADAPADASNFRFSPGNVREFSCSEGVALDDRYVLDCLRNLGVLCVGFFEELLAPQRGKGYVGAWVCFVTGLGGQTITYLPSCAFGRQNTDPLRPPDVHFGPSLLKELDLPTGYAEIRTSVLERPNAESTSQASIQLNGAREMGRIGKHSPAEMHPPRAPRTRFFLLLCGRIPMVGGIYGGVWLNQLEGDATPNFPLTTTARHHCHPFPPATDKYNNSTHRRLLISIQRSSLSVCCPPLRSSKYVVFKSPHYLARRI